MAKIGKLTEKTGRELVEMANALSIEEIYKLSAEHSNRSLAELQWLFGFGKEYRVGASPEAVETTDGERKILISGCYGTATNVGADAATKENNIKSALPPDFFLNEEDFLKSRLTILQMSFSPYYAVFSTWLAQRLPNRLIYQFVATNATEAVDNAIRIACYYNKAKGRRPPIFLTVEGSDHGLFSAPLAASSSARAEELKRGLTGFLNDSAYRQIEPGADALLEAVRAVGKSRAVALLSATAIEPGVFAEMARAAKEEGILLIADETQATSESDFTLCNEFGLRPDILALAPQARIDGLNEIGVCAFTTRINEIFLGVEKSLKINHTMGNCPFVSRAALEKVGREPRKIDIPWKPSLAGRLKKELAKLSPDSIGQFLLCSSGAGAVERGMMLARKKMAAEGKSRFVVFNGAFHGRTVGSASATGYPVGDKRADKKKGIETILFDDAFVWANFNDLDGLERLIERRPDVGVVMLEPIQGEAGAITPSPGFLAGVQKLCREKGLLFFLDEVQTSFGKLGAWTASELWGLKPDIITYSKGLTGGAKVPFGAIGFSKELEKFAEENYPGWMATMDAPNLTGVNVALATIERLRSLRVELSENDAEAIRRECTDSEAAAGEISLFENARLIGAYIASRMRKLQTQFEIIKDIRHVGGMMIGVEFEPPYLKDFNDFFTYFLAANALKRGHGIMEPSLIRPTIRIQPYLGLSRADADKIVETFEIACRATPNLPACFADLIYKNLRGGFRENRLPRSVSQLFKAVEYIARDYV